MRLLSIITVNLNNRQGLERTIESVISQTNHEFEFIVIDGGSTDGSLEIIQQNAISIDKWVSEPDGGIYPAMNKGIAMATGTYLLFLNSGDWFTSEAVLSNTIPLLKGCDLYAGDMACINPIDNSLRWHMKSPESISAAPLFSGTLPHQATFIKKTLFDRYGFYNEDLKIASDWLFFLEVILEHHATYEHFNLVITNFMLDGISNDPVIGDLPQREQQFCLQKKYPRFVEDYDRLFELEASNSNWISSKEYLVFSGLKKIGVIRIGVFILRSVRLFKKAFRNRIRVTNRSKT